MDDPVDAFYAEIQKRIAQGHFDQGREQAEQTLLLAQESQDGNLESAALTALGQIQLACNSVEQAGEWLQKALVSARKIDNPYREIDALNGLNLIHVFGVNHDERIIAQAHKTIDLAQALDYTDGRVLALYVLGGLYLQRKKDKQAAQYYQETLRLARQIPDRLMETDTINGLGNVYGVQRRYKQALEHYQQALDLAREIGYRTGQSVILGNLGNIQFMGIREYKQALVNYQQALEIARELNHKYGEVNTLITLGVVAFRMYEFDESEAYFQEALTIASETHMQFNEARVFAWLGTLAYRKKNYSQSIEYYQQAITHFAQLNQNAVVRKLRFGIVSIQIRYFLTFRWLFK